MMANIAPIPHVKERAKESMRFASRDLRVYPAMAPSPRSFHDSQLTYGPKSSTLGILTTRRKVPIISARNSRTTTLFVPVDGMVLIPETTTTLTDFLSQVTLWEDCRQQGRGTRVVVVAGNRDQKLAESANFVTNAERIKCT